MPLRQFYIDNRQSIATIKYIAQQQQQEQQRKQLSTPLVIVTLILIHISDVFRSPGKQFRLVISLTSKGLQHQIPNTF